MAINAPGDTPVRHRDDRVRDQRADAAQAGPRTGGGPGPEGCARGYYWQWTDLVHRRAASAPGDRGQGTEPRGAAEVLPDREAGHAVGLVPRVGRAEVRQLAPEGWPTAQGAGHSEAGRRDGLANVGWGYTKIRDALRTGLRIEIGRTTVASILAEEGIEPAPEREKKRTWKQFMKMHWETLYACDFFSVEVLGISGTVRYMVFFVIEIKSRAVEIAGITVDPGEAWMKQVARNLTDPVDGFLRGAKSLVHDRDPLFTEAFIAILEAGGVKSVKIPAQSPNCNPHAERFVKTIKYEGLNQFVIFGERHLRYLIKEFVEHYMTERFHQGIGGQLIRNVGPTNDNGADGKVACRSRLAGILNFYYREAA